ncbi:uncharacterized protein LOC109825818 [Asparagus officinalis]|uniref:uncharacterized protein LOC109825818 n=1 Tax=Asparagus officinalis TaxID=4686 RepID=UPI00098E587F|nr:uncharacterized protein LOC109825818 [Asparagus officinalis]
MASPCLRSMNRTSISSFKSFITKSKLPSSTRSQSFASRFISRSPVELGCVSGSLFPSQSAVPMSGLASPMILTSRSFSSLSQDQIFVEGCLQKIESLSFVTAGKGCAHIIVSSKCSSSGWRQLSMDLQGKETKGEGIRWKS